MARIVAVESINTYGATNYDRVETDWLEDDDFHIFKINLPGLTREDVTVQIVGEILQVSGVRKNGPERAYGKWHIKERPVGTFFRKFQLPGEVKANEIIAIDENGVLVIRVPKKRHFIRDIPIAML